MKLTSLRKHATLKQSNNYTFKIRGPLMVKRKWSFVKRQKFVDCSKFDGSSNQHYIGETMDSRDGRGRDSRARRVVVIRSSMEGRPKWRTDCSLDNGRPSSLAWSGLKGPITVLWKASVSR